MRPLVDWVALLGERRVPYIERGPNVKRGEVNIQCPFCGSADPSHHMGLNLDTGWWSCWRNKQHSGKSPVRLLMALLRVSFGEARDIAGLGDDYRDPEGFDSVKARLQALGRPVAAPERRACAWPPSFHEIDGVGASRRHWAYLRERGFDEVDYLVERYRLSFTRSGPMAHRVILPFVVDGEVVTYTGRAIAPSSARYLDQPLDEAAIGPKQTLYNHDALHDGGHALVVVEGPFDVLKVDFHGRPFGVRAVGMSTSGFSEAQAHLLAGARDRFRRVVVMSDQTPGSTGAVDAMRLRQALAFVPRVESMPPPFGLKDAGELNPRQATNWARMIASEETS